MINVAAILLAAGNSRRMGGPNKLLQLFNGRPLVAYAVAAISAAHFSSRIMISGRDHFLVEQFGLKQGFTVVHNQSFQKGIGTSLATGFSMLQKLPAIDGALVMLADMPLVSAKHLDQMHDAFTQAQAKRIVRASHKNTPGNPVLIPRLLFSKMAELDGDHSGQAILKASGIGVDLVEIGPAALMDIDTPEALARLHEALI